MRADLSVVSFLCAGLLAVFLPARRVRGSVVTLAIVAWLIGCNLVHGINSLIWNGNVRVRGAVWCDITTKLLLGATVALPGACVCMSRRLELVASTRKLAVDPTSQRNRILFDLTLCYVIPLVYMMLRAFFLPFFLSTIVSTNQNIQDFIAQDHRFDLVQDFGCFASIYPSTPSLMIIWIPPLLICGISFLLSGFAIHNSFRHSTAGFSHHLETRAPITTSLFLRRLVTSLVVTGVLTIVCLFSVFSISSFQRWGPWSVVHAHFRDVHVVTSSDEARTIQSVWWGMKAVSIAYIILSFAIGEEARDSFKWVRNRLTQRRQPTRLRPFALPTTTRDVQPQVAPSTSEARLQNLDMKSGWDDMLESKQSKVWFSIRKSPSPSRCTPSPTSTPPPRSPTADEKFITSTLDYLSSPTAKSLTVHPPLPSPPHVYASPKKATHNVPFPSPPSPPPAAPIDPESSLLDNTASQRNRDKKKRHESGISSLFDVAWPQPPATSSPASSSKAHLPNSNLNSDTASVSDSLSFGLPLYIPATPPHLRTRPFDDASVSFPLPVSGQDSWPEESPLSAASRRQVSKKPSLKSLRSTRSGREDRGAGYRGEVIYMTVVKETVDSV